MAGRIAYYGNIVTQGLVLDFDAANMGSNPKSGLKWYDISGNNLTGSLLNGASFVTSDYGAVVFDGVNDVVNVTDSSVLDPTTLTISTWVKPNFSALRTTEIFVHGDNITGWYLELGGAGNPIFFIGATTRNSAFNLTPDIWQNLTITYDTTNIRFYTNGTLRSTSGNTTAITRYTSSAKIGDWIGGGYPFSGSISSIQLYNRVLSQAEISQNFNAYRSRYGI